MNNLDAALGYAKKGMKIFPCKIDKSPMTENGYKNATDDVKQIRKWWSENPTASIGMPCGKINGLWVLDIDMPDGLTSLSLIEKEHGRIPTDTLTQRTGGNGVQYFFKWTATIRNSSGKIGKNIDVRGDGGYVILPPSSHPSGNQYSWISRKPSTVAPDWLIQLAQKANSNGNGNTLPKESTYGQKALAGELMKIAGAGEGERNDTLNTAAYSLGQLVGGGELTKAEVEASLMGIAMGKGLTMKEAQATIKSGIESGMKFPRTAPKREEGYHFDFGDEKQSKQTEAEVSNGKQRNHWNQRNQGNQLESRESVGINLESNCPNLESNGINGNQNNDSDDVQSPYNLHTLIGEWIVSSTGYFTNADVDREFNLTTRQEKLNRAKSLYRYKEKEIIRADKKIKGRWHVIDNKIEWIDINNIEETTFPINLPFGLHEKVSIPNKSIIVIAGTTNAGKTAFILNTLSLNLKQKYEKVYLMSEMGSAEYKHRVVGTGCDVKDWHKNIKAAMKSYDYDGTIKTFNPDGLTCIDYLEEIDGEYFKIASSIRDIYDSIGDGVAMIAIQKRGQAEFGRGGEATAEKARLYMTIDFLCALEHCIICALKITKAKHSLKENMIGKEIHFKIEHGSRLTPIMDWTYSGKVNRGQCVMEYQMAESCEEPTEFKFMTLDGEVTLKHKDHMEWMDRFKKLDLNAELRRVSELSYIKPWMNRKKWYFQLGAHLEKQEKGVMF